jgi:uncharacterized protein YecE (DUF72 family)
MSPTGPRTELTLEERRERRRLRREKQREDNVKRAAKMHDARLKSEAGSVKSLPPFKQSVFVGCSGWRYWKWRDSFYEGVPQNDWFKHYLKSFDTVEINASFYSWPTVAGVQSWRRQAGKEKFVYTVKVSEHITHIKRFKGTKTLVEDFGLIADILGERMGCFLFQLPPSYRYTKSRLIDIAKQLVPSRRNVVEFRHASWWNEEVYSAFRKAGIIFCSCSGPRLPEELIRTTDEVYLRLHGPKRWYRHNYSNGELTEWADRIRASGAKRVWIYFNNDNDAYAPKNAIVLRRMLKGRSPAQRSMTEAHRTRKEGRVTSGSDEWLAAGYRDCCARSVAGQRIGKHDIRCREFRGLTSTLHRGLCAKTLDRVLRHC